MVVRNLMLALCAVLCISACPAKAAEIAQDQLAETFKGYDASFVLLDTSTMKAIRYNPELCKVRMTPCSTYKIFNSLVGLESGVIKDENHTYRWDGKKSTVSADWDRDQTLQSAITNSVVWYYQRLAAAVGAERMQKYLDQEHYGNADISGGITQFWLASTLKISADEQVAFLQQLVSDDLQFSKRSMAIVRGIMRLEQTPRGTLYGKTGSDRQDGKWTLGWFVGYVVQPDKVYVFATNLQAADGAWGKKARELTIKILNASGLL